MNELVEIVARQGREGISTQSLIDIFGARYGNLPRTVSEYLRTAGGGREIVPHPTRSSWWVTPDYAGARSENSSLAYPALVGLGPRPRRTGSQEEKASDRENTHATQSQGGCP